MIGCSSGADWRLIAALLAGLLFFGIAYDVLVTRLAHRKDGYTALLVVGGVLVTLGAMALVSWQCALLTLGFFVASGTPMIIGDIVRSIRQREETMKRFKDLYDVDKA
jgi:uncharacterized membrane protein YraQ (UPF0718 family)